MEYHRSVVWQLVEQSRRLALSLVDIGLEQQYEDRAQQLYQLTNDVKRSHQHLLLSMDQWNKFESSSKIIEEWQQETSAKLAELVAKIHRGETIGQEECIQYWVSYFIPSFDQETFKYFKKFGKIMVGWPSG